MGPYYDAISLMIWRLPEPRQTPWAAYRGAAPEGRPRRRLLQIGGPILRRPLRRLAHDRVTAQRCGA
ncbi:MAG: hypothetical protein QNJ30_05520 [Kiloniellales bacterium]|nr:hypothetical protein [Kiloniellales bacterium]